MHRENKPVKKFAFKAFFLSFALAFSFSFPALSACVLIPSGQAIGISIDTEGLYIAAVTSVTQDGKLYSPAADAGLRSGDILISVNGSRIENTRRLSDIMKKSGGDAVTVEYTRKGKLCKTVITPFLDSSDGKFKLGLLLKSGTTGIGTLTFIDPETMRFGALGHAISDSSTGTAIHAKNGMITKTKITAVDRARSGEPGELKGMLDPDKILGTIKINCGQGIFGTYSGGVDKKDALETAESSEVKVGQAYILSTINGETVEKFSVEITALNKQISGVMRDMCIKITDSALLERTGGIVQGMSGSPIIQNGKLVGAVTHVLISDSASGYGIFIEKMLSSAGSVENALLMPETGCF